MLARVEREIESVLTLREMAGQPKSGSGRVAAASIFHPVGDGSAARLLSENTQCTAVEKSKRLLSVNSSAPSVKEGA